LLVWVAGTRRLGATYPRPPALALVMSVGRTRPATAVRFEQGGRLVRLGPAPPVVAPWQQAAWYDGSLWVAMGRAVDQVRPSGRVVEWSVSGGTAMMAYAENGRLWMLTSAPGGTTWLWRRCGGAFVAVARVPGGLPRFVAGRTHPWLLLILPHRTVLWWPGGHRQAWNEPAPETAVLTPGGLWVPTESLGVERLGPGPTRHRYRPPPGDAVLAVVGQRPWLVTTGGMVPVVDGRPAWEETVPWPSPPPAGLTATADGPWIFVQTSAAGGWWFWTGSSPRFEAVREPVPAYATVLDMVPWPR
jgi:hypothetical protein